MLITEGTSSGVWREDLHKMEDEEEHPPTNPKRVYSADIRRETSFSLSLSSFFARVLVLVLVARFDS